MPTDSSELDKTTNSDRSHLVGKIENEFSYRDDKKIPLQVTRLQLSWGSTRLHKNSHRSMHIKNTSKERLVIKVDVSGPGFQIVNFHGNIIYLQAQECRSICLNFRPTVIGAAVGVLSFSSPNISDSQTFLNIPLYGYGGTASIIPENLILGPAGTPVLPMGEVKDLTTRLEKTFTIYNKGPLHGFAVIVVDSFGLDMSRMCDAFQVTPNKVLIPPKEVVNIRVSFIPRRDDIKNIILKISKVMTLAHLRLFCGDEPTRQRIRNLFCTMDEEEKSKLNSRVLTNIWVRIPGEKPIDDLETIKEEPEVALDMVSRFRVHDIALTLNNNQPDETALDVSKCQ